MGIKTKKGYRSEYYALKNEGKLQTFHPSLTGKWSKDKLAFKQLMKIEIKEAEETIESKDSEVLALSDNTTLHSPDFLLTYLNTHSPSGCEFEAQKVWSDYVAPYVDEFKSDSHGNQVAIKDATGKSRPFKLMIEAHCDEISYIITKIEPSGLIYVMRNGGSDEAIAPSKKVFIHVDNATRIPAVFGWIAIHIREQSIKPDRNSIFLDAGFNNEDEVKKAGIAVGQYVTYDDDAAILNDKVIGKSVDNKVGGYIIAEVMRMLHPHNLEIEVLASNSVQEEVGLHGAEMVAINHKPNAVIVTDVCHDTTTPGIVNKLIGDLHIGRGPVLLKGAAVHGRFTKVLENLSSYHKIPFQVSACSGRGTGTDADVFTYANGGTPTTLIKMPLKYMHTTVEMVSISDIQGAIKLMYEAVLYVNSNYKSGMFKSNDFTNYLEDFTLEPRP